ncbi:hypothetical protein [Shewanella algae]|uniref:toxin-antitoxin system YwqK family antitoxin n=1 Tax=Shewanella algae TaxID=38313 RepID=UPI00313CDC14
MERLFQPGLLTGLFLLIFSPLSSASELAHGPLTLPAGDNEQLSFFRDGEQLLAQIKGDNDSETLDSFPAATQVVAVFYQDLDGDEQREVLVMLKTGSELSIRGYGRDYSNWQWLQRLQPRLDRLAPSLKHFTVAEVRKQLKRWPPQQYLMTYDIDATDDANIRALLQGALESDGQLLGYRDEEGRAVKRAEQAYSYRLKYPVSIKEGQTAFFLTASFERLSFGIGEAEGFMVTEVAYQRDDIEGEAGRSGPLLGFTPTGGTWGGVTLSAYYQGGKLHGSWASYSPRNGRINAAGDYKNGLQQGEWIEADFDGRFWRGQYVDGKQQGLWKLESDYDETLSLGFANYKDGLLHGEYEELLADFGSDAEPTPTKIWLKGVYLDNKRHGPWIEDGNRVTYDHGLKDGLWVEMDGESELRTHYHQGKKQGLRQRLGRSGKLLLEENYLADQLDGQSRYFYASGQLKKLAQFKQGKQDGQQLYFHENGQLSSLYDYQAYQDKEGRWYEILQGQVLRYSEQGQLLEVQQYRDARAEGRWYRFDKQGQLERLQNFSQGLGQGMQASFSPHGISSFRTVEKGISIGDGYRFHRNGQLQEINFYCDYDGAATSNNLCGWQHSFYEDGQDACFRRLSYGYEQEYICYDREGRLLKSQELTAANKMVERRYINGKLHKEEPRISVYNRMINGEQVYNFNGARFDGVVIGIYHDGRYETLYRDGKKICGKQFDPQGKLKPGKDKCEF